jgi:SAM-dependent methyltransferase
MVLITGKYMQRTNCLCCDSKNLSEVIDLGMHPYADTFITKDKYFNADKFYPLIVDLCEQCHCIQTRCITSPYERYVENNYSYSSSNSKYSMNHWIDFAKDTSLYLTDPNDVVYEIGCNDGFLLEQYKNIGYKVKGIDASPFMCDLMKSKGLDVSCGVFDSKYADEEECNFKLIIANNVLNHSNNPLDFLLGVKKLLAQDGIFVFELPYWAEGVADGKFDQIYHEHVTYFTESFAVNLTQRAELSVIKIEKVNYHGVSLRVFCSNKKQLEFNISNEEWFDENLFKKDFYIRWSKGIEEKRNNFMCKIYDLAHKRIVAIGAAAKGNTFLNYYNLNSSLINFVTDNSDYKVGKFTPGTRIPIVKDEELKNAGELNAIILSWNISDILKEKLLVINPNLRYIE